jgi:uncharacterized membrane protein
MLDLKLDERRADRYVWVFIGVYFVVFAYVCFLKLTSFSYGDFDLAVDEQFLWSLGRAPLFNPILGTHFFGNHLHFILLFLAPFYKLYPYPITLLWLQTLSLGLGAWPLFLLAKRKLGPSWALFVSGLYLFYPPLAYINLFEFHPAAFSAIFLLFMLYFYYSERFLPFILFMCLAMLCQENIPLCVAALGIYSCILRRHLRWVLAPIASGLLYFLLAVKVLVPYFNKNTLQFLLLYSHFGSTYSEIFLRLLLHPFLTLRIILQPHKLYYLMQLFGPLSFVPFLSPAALIPALPFFLQHLLSNRVNEVTIYFHYAAELIPFIFVAFIFGLKRFLSLEVFKKRSWVAALWLCAMMLWGSFWLGPHFSLPKATTLEWNKDPKDRIKEAFLKEIPADASVVATFEFLPFLTHRRGIYSFHHVYSGRYTMSKKPYKLPEDVTYALLDFNDGITFTLKGFFHPGGYENIQKFLKSGSWGVVDALDSIVLFKKMGKSDISLYEVTDTPQKPQNKTPYVVENSLELLGYDFVHQDGRLRVTFYWHCLHSINRDITVFFHLVDKYGKVIYETFIPLCYRIYPAIAWKEGEYIRETKFLPFAAEVRDGGAQWKMGFYDFLTGQGYPVTDNDIFGRIDLNLK